MEGVMQLSDIVYRLGVGEDGLLKIKTEDERKSRELQENIEHRVSELEKKVNSILESAVREKALVKQYGECVDKTKAAQILGVTRVTVYAMLGDGRLKGSMNGKKVDVRSICRLLESGGKR